MAEQIFYVRGRQDASRLLNVGLLVYMAMAPAFVPMVILVTVLAAATNGMLAVFAAIALSLPLFGLIAARGLRHRLEKAHVEVTDDTLILRGNLPDMRIPVANIASVTQSAVGIGDMLRAAGWSPWNATLFVLRYPSARTLRLTLSRGVTPRWWPFNRYRTVLADPEDWPGFIAAVRQVAPHVTIDAALVE
jgi:hypothetical protein